MLVPSYSFTQFILKLVFLSVRIMFVIIVLFIVFKITYSLCTCFFPSNLLNNENKFKFKSEVETFVNLGISNHEVYMYV